MYLIGVDGGGTKTESMIVNLDGSVVAEGVAGPSNPRSIGVEKAVLNIAESIKKAFSGIEKKEVTSVLVGIPAFKEEYGEKEEEIKERLVKNIEIFSLNKEKIILKSDQEVAFCSGTNEKNGVVAIAGTGSVVRGWNNERDVKTGGWGWLADKSGAFQIGQEAYQKAVEALDGRIEKTLLTELVLKNFKAEGVNDLNKIIYQKDPIGVLAPLSVLVNEAAERGDETARKILEEAGKSLVFSAKNTIKKLEFREKFPFVFVGGMFKSDIFLSTFKEELLSYCPKAQIVIPKEKPVTGAVKIALKSL